VCLRFFDDAVREVGSCVIVVPTMATPADILAEAKRHIRPDWNMTGPLRALEVVDGQIARLFHADSRGMLSSKANIFYNSIRIEQDPDSVPPPGHTQLEVYHCDRSSQQAFAQPFVLTVSPGELCKAIKVRIRTKLNVPEQEFKSWRLVKCIGVRKIHLKDEEAWDADQDASIKQLCLEHVHPNPSSNTQKNSRYNKPLMIK
jgi:ubiquitin carboxyl-terminal hydrolase 7